MSHKKHEEKNAIHLLSQLNQNLINFIKNSIESPSDLNGEWCNLSEDFKPLRCWEIKGCESKGCPAYGSDDIRCWLRVGTLCGGEIQGEFAKKYRTCFDCDVLRTTYENPIRALCENINTLIFHLKSREVKLHELAIKDQLTGIHNRHFFNEVIEREIARAERYNEGLSFIMIDLDHFKEINDTLGHLTGDRILIEAAMLIKNTLRRSDLVFRFGGDEFLVLLLNADCEKASKLVERLLVVIDKWNKENADAVGCRLSFSIGCATCEKCGDVLATLKEADAKMYQNKKNKKNEVIIKNER